MRVKCDDNGLQVIAESRVEVLYLSRILRLAEDVELTVRRCEPRTSLTLDRNDEDVVAVEIVRDPALDYQGCELRLPAGGPTKARADDSPA